MYLPDSSKTNINRLNTLRSAGSIAFFALFLMLNALNPATADDFSYSKRIYLDKAAINSQEKTRVMLYTSKFSIYPQYSQSPLFIQTPAVQGADPISGLIGAIIGAAIVNEGIKSERNAAIAFNNDIDTAMTSVDINSEIQLAVQAELSKGEQFSSMEFENVSHINELAQPGLLIRIEEKSILTLLTRVHFDAQLKSLCFETSSKIWRKNEAKPIYFSELNYSSAYLPESNKTDLKKRWAANNGELLKAKLKEGIAEISHMLANDLSKNHAVESDAAQPMLIETLNSNTNKKMQTTLYTVEEMPDRLIGRLGSPESSLLASIPKTNFTIRTAP